MAVSRGNVVRGVDLDKRIDAIDCALDVMERFSGKLADAEQDVQMSLRRRDREYKDSHFAGATRSKRLHM